MTGYRIEVSVDAGGRWADLESDTGTLETTYAHTGLAPDSKRHYRVSAINEAGVGEVSNVAEATTDPARVAGRVIDLVAAADGQTLINLDWREPEDDGGAAITGYRIEVSWDAGMIWTDLESDTGTTDTTYSHTGLEPATTGHYRVSAINAVGLSDPSDAAFATTDPARVAARVLDLVALADGQDVINLHWSEPEEDGGAAITGYRIEVSADAGRRWADLESDTRTTDTRYAHAGLTPDSTRHYRVSAWNEAGLSDPSNEASARTADKHAYNLAAFGRTVATSAVGVIGGRLNEAQPDTPSYLVLGGQTIRLGNGRRDERKRPPRTEADDEWAPPGRAGKSDESAPATGATTSEVEAGDALTPAAGEPPGPAGTGEAPAPTTGAAAGPARTGEPLPSIAGAPARGLPLPGALASVSRWADTTPTTGRPWAATTGWCPPAWSAGPSGRCRPYASSWPRAAWSCAWARAGPGPGPATRCPGPCGTTRRLNRFAGPVGRGRAAGRGIQRLPGAGLPRLSIT